MLGPSGLDFAQPCDISECEGVFESETSGDTDKARGIFVGEGFGECDEIGGLNRLACCVWLLRWEHTRAEKAEYVRNRLQQRESTAARRSDAYSHLQVADMISLTRKETRKTCT